MEYVYIISNQNIDNILKKNIKLLKVHKNKIQRDYFNDEYESNMKYIIINNRIFFIIPIIKKNCIINTDIDFDILINTNKDLLKIYNEKYNFNNDKLDLYFIKNYNFEIQMWYFYYFKKNIDILNLVNVFQKMQNIDIKWYIGKYLNDDDYKIKLKNYFNFIFGKYNIVNEYLVKYFYKIVKSYLLNEYILVKDLFYIFKDYEYILEFLNILSNNIKYYYYDIILFKNNHIYYNNTNIGINILLLLFYSRFYIHYIKKIFNTKDFLDIINFKKLYMYSMCNFKIYEYISLFNLSDNLHSFINNFSFDFHIIDCEIKLVFYENNNNYINFLKTKYKNLIV